MPASRRLVLRAALEHSGGDVVAATQCPALLFPAAGRAGQGGAVRLKADDGPRSLPAVDRVLRAEGAERLIARYGRPLVLEAVREALLRQRREGQGASLAAILDGAAQRLAAWIQPSQRRVFNLTGTILHTNLGRAPLAEEAIAAAVEAMREPSTLEYDLERGRRGERDSHIAGWLTRLSGAEAALAVNNNAAALVLALNTLALGREAIVSRGELIEIGGSFRLPEILMRAGARLVEVGTTNRTHLADYAAAIGPETGVILKVHPSNYEIRGFTASVPAKALSVLGRERGVPVIEDLGSGSLVALEGFGLPHEPTVGEAVAAGADLVTFSGDKLLGGPQAGLVVGRADLVAKLARNSMKRALRLDKIRLAALEATLKLYADPDRLAARLPALRLLARPQGEIAQKAQTLLPAFVAALGKKASVAVVSTNSQIGSGALPLSLLPSAALALTPAPGISLKTLAAAFRALPIPVIGRIEEGRLILDLRALEESQALCEELPRLGESLSAADSATGP